MRELEAAKKYEGKVVFNIVPTSKDVEQDVKSFGIGTHGLVGFDSGGKMATKIPGHNFGKGEIIQAIDTLLAG